MELNGAVHRLLERGVAIPINGGVEYETTVGFAVRRHVGAAASEAEPKGCARMDAADRSLPAAIGLPTAFP
jgi:hypothetical protein